MILVASPPARAQPGAVTQELEPGGGEAGLLRSLRFGLATGYAIGIAIRPRQRGKDVADARFFAIEPHLLFDLGGRRGGDAWYRGRWQALLEASLLLASEPRRGEAGGLLAGLRYRFRPEARWQPFTEAGLGVGGLGFDLRSQADGFVFLLTTGAGLRQQVGSHQQALTARLRWHHISNAQIRQPNDGIDDIMLLIGFEWR